MSLFASTGTEIAVVVGLMADIPPELSGKVVVVARNIEVFSFHRASHITKSFLKNH